MQAIYTHGNVLWSLWTYFNFQVINFSPEPGFQPNSLAYADKHREQDRQGKLAEYQTTGQWPGMDKRKDSKKLEETKVKTGDR